MSKLYAITNQKGGVGKSTTCACLGAALTELGKRVLMVDLDPQAGLTTSLGQDPGAFERTIYNALIDDKISIEEIITKTKVSKKLRCQTFSFCQRISIWLEPKANL